MKQIVKQAEPQEFIDWKAQENENWKPSYKHNFQKPEKPIVKTSLMQEQGGLCCYCERRLFETDSHIEHFKPQESFPEEALNYSNMLCSCQQELAKGEPRHCGNLKDDWYDSALMISPLDSDCESRFSYTHDGRIDAADSTDKAALETIERTGLGIEKLNALREGAIEPFLDESLTAEDLKVFVAEYLKPDEKGYFGEFFTTIRELFGHYAIQSAS